MNWADRISYPMTNATAFAVLYARHATWHWSVTQGVGYETKCFNYVCREGIVFG